MLVYLSQVSHAHTQHDRAMHTYMCTHAHTPLLLHTSSGICSSLFRAKRSFYSGSAEIVWLQPILFAWLLKGRSCSSERARLHRWPSGWQTWLAIFKKTQSAYKPIDLLDLVYLAQKFASALNLRPSSRSSLAASLSS